MSAKRTICFFNPQYHSKAPGGAEIQMFLLGKQFIRHGWDVYYVHGHTDLSGEEEGIKLKSVPKSGDNEELYQHAKKVLDSIQPDLIYQRGRKLYSWLAGRYSKETGTPYIFAASMDIDALKDRQAGRADQQGVSFLKRIVRQRRNRKTDKLSLEGIRGATLTLVQSEVQEKLFQENLNISSKIYRNIHEVPAASELQKADPPVVLWLASVKAWKQPQVFMEAARKLKDLPCRFVLAGRIVDEQFREPLAQQDREQANFSYIEQVDFARSNELIGEASVFVNTSQKNEGFPNTYIQSWLREVPVITLNFDPDDLIKNRKLGFHAKTTEQLLTDIRRLVEDEALRKQMGADGRSWASETFGAEANFGRLATFADQLVPQQ